MWQEFIQSDWVWPLIVFTGLCFGSFISLISYRMPRDLPYIRERSRCPACKTALSARDLMPVLSYIMAGRACRHCRAPMSPRYVWIEIGTAASFVGLFWLLGPTVLFLIMAGYAVCLITLIVTDLEHYMIPDTVQLATLVLGLFYVWHLDLPLDLRIATGFAMFGVGAALHYGSRWILGKDGLGFGDVKFMGAAGVWLAVDAIPSFLFLSGLLGISSALVWRVLGQGPRFPFGPALGASLLCCVLWPESVDFTATLTRWIFA